VLRTPIRAPRADATCERFLGSVCRECTDHLLVLEERHLSRMLREYIAYVNGARPHQGIGQRLLLPATAPRASGCGGTVVARPMLGGLHHDDQRAA